MMSKAHKSKKSSKDATNSAEHAEAKKLKLDMKPEPKDAPDTDDDFTFENNNEVKPKKSKTPEQKKEKKPVSISAENDIEEDESANKDWKTPPQDTIDWPEKDLIELFNRMETAIPDKDSLVFSTRIEKLSWEEIAFNDYSGEQCKMTWLLVQKRLRKYRLLKEVLHDAKTWLAKPWTNFYKGGKNKRHPDMPRRPLSSYMLFYMKKKNKVQEEFPSLEMPEISKKIAEMYKSLPQNKKAKYDKLAVEKRGEYEERLEEFHRLHPDIPKHLEKPSTTKTSPSEAALKKKPSTPFHLYYVSQLEKHSDADKVALREKTKTQWKAMSDKKKVVWIDWALEEESKYNEAVKNYVSQNPSYVPSTIKPILTKEERLLKERIAGKPTKPPMSAYSLFSRELLKSEEIKQILVKDRMNYIATQWKNCGDDAKKCYRDKVAHLLEQYKLEYASYLESLPAEKRDEELQNNMPKRKAKKPSDSIPKKKKVKVDILKNEPLKPPKSPYKLFVRNYVGEKSPEEAWKSMSKDEQKRYQTELDIVKKEYLAEFKKFLENLDKKQLKEFADRRKNRKTSDNEDSPDDANDAESSECSSDDSA